MFVDVKGVNELVQLFRNAKRACEYLGSVDGKQTTGGEFVPNQTRLYADAESATAAKENEEVIRAADHEMYEVDRRLR